MQNACVEGLSMLEEFWIDCQSRNMYVNQCNTVNQLIFQSKMRYYSGLIEENKSDQKKHSSTTR